MTRIRRTTLLTILLVIAIGGTTIVWAQNAALPASVVAAAPAEMVDPNSVRLLVGRSTVVDVGTSVARVSLTSPDIADALVTSPNQLLINGKMPGTISMFVWDRGGALRRYEIVVQRDLARLSEQLRQLFPGESIDAHSNGKNIVLSGAVTSKDVIEKAVNVASGYVDKRDEVVPLLQIQAGAPSNQVLLRVRFAEVSRSAMTQIGASLFTSPTGVKNTLGRTTTQQFPGAPGFTDLKWSKESGDFGAPVTSAEGQFQFTDFLNVFLFSQKYDLGAMIKALQSRGQFQSLAEPNLVAESGKEASFLAGGEFPVPIAQGSGANLAVSVIFKEFGIRLTFTPTVVGDRVHLKLKPEVSTLDFANAVTLSGFRIPSLSTRRTETELELQSGQTFAIAGLMNNTVTSTMQKIPGIGDIPILGYFFKSKAAEKNQTELVVMITPVILPNNSRGVTPNLPRMPEPYLSAIPEKKAVAPPPPAFGAVQSAAPVMAARPNAPVQQGQLSPAAAAGVVSNLTPSNTPRLQGSAPAATPAVAASPAATPSPAVAAPASTPPSASVKPLSEKELKAMDKARREEEEKAEKAAREQAKIDARAKAGENKRLARQAEIDRKAEAKERERQEKLAKEQAKRDAEAAKKAQEAAKKQAELDRNYRKSLDVAAAKLKAAESAYNAELARSQQQ